jgi:hypothetical protein
MPSELESKAHNSQNAQICSGQYFSDPDELQES